MNYNKKKLILSLFIKIMSNQNTHQNMFMSFTTIVLCLHLLNFFKTCFTFFNKFFYVLINLFAMESFVNNIFHWVYAMVSLFKIYRCDLIFSYIIYFAIILTLLNAAFSLLSLSVILLCLLIYYMSK